MSSPTGAPVAGARVWVEGWTLQDTSAADGSFRLRPVPQGTHWIRAEATVGGRRLAGERGPLQVGQSVSVAIALRDITDEPPVGNIAGTVFDENGDVVIGAEVRVEGRDAGGEGTSAVRNGVRGGFLLTGLAPGSYTLLGSAITPDERRLEGRLNNVQVRAGQTTVNANLVVFPLGQAGTLVGRVESARGGPIMGATVAADLAGNWISTTTDTTGAYQLPGVPASLAPWQVVAFAPGFELTTSLVSMSKDEVRERDFLLLPTSGGLPYSPSGLIVNALTYPRAVQPPTRSTYGAVRWAVYRRSAVGKAARWDKARQASAAHRRWPAGGLVEIDAFWSPVEGQDVGGYWLQRSLTATSGYLEVADVPQPLAFFAADMDADLTVGNRYFYRVQTYSSRRIGGGVSKAVSTMPLGMVELVSPVPGADAAPTNPEFRWQPLERAQSYLVALFGAFPSARLEPLWMTNPLPSDRTRVLYDGPSLQRGQTYYWVVAAFNQSDLEEADAESWSEIAAFRVADQ